jgi:hypothetical protein
MDLVVYTGGQGMEKASRFPKSLDILSTRFKVSLFDELIKVDPDGAFELFGLISYLTSEIRVYCKNQGQIENGAAWKILFHEMLHALFRDLNLEGKVKKDELENVIDALSVGLFDTLSRNKLLNK